MLRNLLFSLRILLSYHALDFNIFPLLPLLLSCVQGNGNYSFAPGWLRIYKNNNPFTVSGTRFACSELRSGTGSSRSVIKYVLSLCLIRFSPCNGYSDSVWLINSWEQKKSRENVIAINGARNASGGGDRSFESDCVVKGVTFMVLSSFCLKDSRNLKKSPSRT